VNGECKWRVLLGQAQEVNRCHARKDRTGHDNYKTEENASDKAASHVISLCIGRITLRFSGGAERQRGNVHCKRRLGASVAKPDLFDLRTRPPEKNGHRTPVHPHKGFTLSLDLLVAVDILILPCCLLHKIGDIGVLFG